MKEKMKQEQEKSQKTQKNILKNNQQTNKGKKMVKTMEIFEKQIYKLN